MSVHGLLLLDKPEGITSHDLVAKVRKILNMKSVGHCGTLDPMATGLMVLLLGEATKVSPYLLERDKAYRVRAQLGVRTDTLDMTGQVLETRPVDVSPDRVREAVLALQGEFELSVPVYSAIKVGGEKLYEKARRNEEVETPRKRMKFYDIQILDQGVDWVEADLRCSKGSYIRSWVQQLGANLGTGAAMSALRRTGSEPFTLGEASTLEHLAGTASAAGLLPRVAGTPSVKTETTEATLQLASILARSLLSHKGFLSLPQALPHWKVARVSGQDMALIRNGQISHTLKTILISLFQPGIDEGVKVLSKSDGELLALIGLEEGQGFVVRRVFRY